MAEDVNIRRYQRSDEADAIGMLLGKLPPAEREAEYPRRLVRWKWQYYANPSNPDGEPLIWVARLGDVFGGMVATVPVTVRTPKGPVLGMWGVDFIVSPKMRGTGIGKKLLNAWNGVSGIAFVMGWSPVSFKVAKGVGFEVMWGFSTADILLSRANYAIEQMKDRQGEKLRKLARVIWHFNPRCRRQRLREIRVETALPEGAGKLWERVSRAYTFAVERTDTYLKWRFDDHPTYEYKYICLGEPGDLHGLGVCRVSAGGRRLGVVADLLVDPARADLVTHLFDDVICFLQSQGAYAARMDLPPALAGQILSRYKCSMVKPRGMIVRTEDRALHDAGILSPASWYVSRSDADEDY
jgi:GNAT superfamily N-acetyltransferase